MTQISEQTPAVMKRPTKKSFPIGSEWRRWDLHVHTPASIFANQFNGDWDAYIDRIESAPSSVKVIGATDYLSIDGYTRLCEYQAAGRLSNIELLIPNIEFRAGPKLDKGNPLNIHILVSPRDPNHIQEIERALQYLTFQDKDDRTYSCIKPHFIDLGSRYDKSAITDDAKLKVGMLQFKPSFEDFKKWFEGQEWLRRNALVVVPNGNDGVAGLPLDGFGATREKLIAFADAIFSGNPSDRDHYLGLKPGIPKEKIEAMYRGIKPCVHGSDAHSLEKMFEPDEQRYCWIKADPTFEGLRQILYEPEERVFIGPTPPSPVDETKLIKTVSFGGGTQWFEQPALPVNSGLVAIVGEKGSGKTAITDLIAYACNAWAGEQSSSSFIRKAHNHLDGLSVSVEWKMGATSRVHFFDEPDGLPLVRYLSQDFVEDLCSEDTSAEKLVEAIEAVVFSYIEETERLDSSSFGELRRTKTEHLTDRRNDIRAAISGLNAEIAELEGEKGSRAEKEKLAEKAQSDVVAIEAQLPELQKDANKQAAEILTRERALLQSKQTELAQANRALTKGVQLRAAVLEFSERLGKDFGELVSSAEELGIPPADLVKFRPSLASGFEARVTKFQKDVEKKIADLKGNAEAPTADGTSIADIQARIAAQEKVLAVDTQVKARLLALQKQHQKAQAERDRLQREIKRIDEGVAKALEAKREERWKRYLEYFEVLAEERTTLEELYAPVTKALVEDSTGARSGFELSVKQEVRADDWLATGRDLFDGRKNTIFKQKDLAKITAPLSSAWASGDGGEIRAALENFVSKLAESPQTISDVLNSHVGIVDIYDWLFSPEHIGVQYSLRYQGTELSALSPGTRGIALLVLYLEMDRNDTRPLIIDQPEGNLDNSSIFDSLVPFIRRARKKRQVILVTHNPNLVVATDADQVIIASARKAGGASYPTITYRSGSLEDADGPDSIREEICRLLEGGRYAFSVRETKYGEPLQPSAE